LRQHTHQDALRDEVLADERNRPVAAAGDEAGRPSDALERLVDDRLRRQCGVTTLELRAGAEHRRRRHLADRQRQNVDPIGAQFVPQRLAEHPDVCLVGGVLRVVRKGVNDAIELQRRMPPLPRAVIALAK
jgi:hypothetical protein